MEQQRTKQSNRSLRRNNLNESITLLSQSTNDVQNSGCENETFQHHKPVMTIPSNQLSSTPSSVGKHRLLLDMPSPSIMLIPIQDHRQIVADNDDLFLTRQLLSQQKSTRKRTYNQTTIENDNDEQLVLHDDYFNQRQQQLTNHLLSKRTRYEKLNEVENQPPIIKHKSMHQKQQEQQQMDSLNSYIHDELARQNRGRYPMTHDMPPSYFPSQIPLSNFNSSLFSVDQTTNWIKHPISYYRTNSAPNHYPRLPHSQQQLQTPAFPYRREIPIDVVRSLSPTLTAYDDDEQAILRNIVPSTKKNVKATSQMNSMLMRRNENSINTTTTLTANNKNDCVRNGNISPTYSETSSETSSTCSSDENYLIQQRCRANSIGRNAHWRTYRERENYEALLDLAEKLSDPNRFNQFDVRQFFSYRYKAPNTSTSCDEVPTIRRSGRISPQNRHTITPPINPTSSTQTACVICMCPFKNRQCIRQLPCGHEYHSKCIQKWLDMNNTCPLCRQDWRGLVYQTM